uniref:Uncharacterized protein n=1 Tax=uncultured marine thaumarchaeote KM3_26_B10 TaxID=1456107 RepID=A0A075GYN4_9ARCH|nr:hypothetical protein [uncultured marine thaumarchaeote KM3_26_B10]
MGRSFLQSILNYTLDRSGNSYSHQASLSLLKFLINQKHETIVTWGEGKIRI